MSAAGLIRRALFLAVVVTVAAALPISADTSPPAAQEMAKAPTDSGMPAAAAPAATEQTAPSPKEGGEKAGEVAQFVGDPGVPSAADLLDRALDFWFYNDEATARDYFAAAADAGPGSREAVEALIFLGSTYLGEGDVATATTLFSRGRAVADPEMLALADVVWAETAASRDKDNDAALGTLASAAEQYKGTFVGGWAALEWANIYRFRFEDYATATSILERVIADYQTGPIAEEARVALAECRDWDQPDKQAAIELYEAALHATTITRLRTRALVGMGDCLREIGDYREALAAFSELIQYTPDRPAAKLALAFRADIADRLGDKETAVQDAAAYVATGNVQHMWRARAYEILAKAAFQSGRYDEAQRQFENMLPHADYLGDVGTGYSGAARAGIARCYQARGDLGGALAMMLEAADRTPLDRDRCLFLYQAAGIAQAAGDSRSYASIVDRMVAEFPGSHLTTRLVGHEILPVPDI
jgi:tetratricopeptide (TPR) repeat protein